MATSKLSLYCGALRILKRRKIETLSDDDVGRYALDDEYDKSVAYMLEAGLWNHASRTLALEASTDVEPSFGYGYAFEKPDDYVRLIAIAANDMLWPTLDDFLEEGLYWSAHCDPLFIQYVSDSTDYGMDLSLWPASFVRAVEYDLALRVGPAITAMSERERELLEEDTKKALETARSRDAVNQAVSRPPPGRLVQSRFGSRTSRTSPYWRR
jgi:hypothetical protein